MGNVVGSIGHVLLLVASLLWFFLALKIRLEHPDSIIHTEQAQFYVLCAIWSLLMPLCTRRQD